LKQPRACSSALAAAAAWPPMSERAIGGNGGERGLSNRVPPVPLSFPCSLVSFRMFSLALMHV
jgi:hypothetical protein